MTYMRQVTSIGSIVSNGALRIKRGYTHARLSCRNSGARFCPTIHNVRSYSRCGNPHIRAFTRSLITTRQQIRTVRNGDRRANAWYSCFSRRVSSAPLSAFLALSLSPYAFKRKTYFSILPFSRPRASVSIRNSNRLAVIPARENVTPLDPSSSLVSSLPPHVKLTK